MTFDDFKSLLMSDRSVRRFDASFVVDEATLRKLVGLTRYCASGRNIQPLKYRLVYKEEEKNKVFPLLKWAGYYQDWDGPSVGERPSAYIVQCLDTDISSALLCDDGLHLQAISLGATTLGLSGCIIKAFDAEKVKEELALPENIKPLYVYAIGKGAEKVMIVDLEEGGDYKYFRGENDEQCVPKRSENSLIL